MEISDFHASTIILVRASFVLSGFNESPESITEALGIRPDSTQVCGDTRVVAGKARIPIRENQWAISCSSQSKNVNHQIRELLVRLAGKELLIRPEWSPAFDVLWKGNYLHAGSGPFYESDVLAGMARFGASLWQDIYQVLGDDSATGQ